MKIKKTKLAEVKNKFVTTKNELENLQAKKYNYSLQKDEYINHLNITLGGLKTITCVVNAVKNILVLKDNLKEASEFLEIPFNAETPFHKNLTIEQILADFKLKV